MAIYKRHLRQGRLPADTLNMNLLRPVATFLRPVSPSGGRVGASGWVRLAAVATLLSALLVACGSSGDKDAPAATSGDAERLTRQFITLLQQKDTAGLRNFLDDSFMIQRADGSFATKESYLTNLPAIGEFSIANVSFKQQGSALVVRWELTVNEVINGQPYRGAPAPRLSTFVYHDGEWRMMSHANFNAPSGPVN